MQNYSVLMTMYKKDNPYFAKLAIDSMLNQTIKTDDFVLICDGPLTAELNELLNLYKERESCFNIIYLPQNVGLGAALRYGVLFCKHELIARMDDDDIARERRCQKELEEFEKNKELGICGTFMYEFEDDPNSPIRIKHVPEDYDNIVKYSKRRNPFNHSTVMFKKEEILKVGNYSPMRTNQDVDLWIRALNNGVKGINIPEPLVDFRFDKSTYQRRKNWKNVSLLIKVWKNFWRSGYCSWIDFCFVSVTQITSFVAPQALLKWAYDNLR